MGFSSPLTTEINHAISGHFLIDHAATNAPFGFQHSHCLPLFAQFAGGDLTRQACTDHDRIHRRSGGCLLARSITPENSKPCQPPSACQQ